MPAGFTQIEILVVIVMLSIIGTVIATSYPFIRAEQKLTLAEQTLQAALRAAQQSAINEERDPACIPQAQRLGTDVKKCSDTGITLQPAQNVIIVFADIHLPDANTYDDGPTTHDFFIRNIPFPDGVQVEPSIPPTVLIFEGVPPTIKLYSGPNEVTSAQRVVLRIGNHTRELNVGSYGQVEKP